MVALWHLLERSCTTTAATGNCELDQAHAQLLERKLRSEVSRGLIVTLINKLGF